MSCGIINSEANLLGGISALIVTIFLNEGVVKAGSIYIMASLAALLLIALILMLFVNYPKKTVDQN